MNNYYIKIDLQLFHDHETQEPVESVQAEGSQRVLNLREESVVGHFLMRPHIVPGVQLINVTRRSETEQRQKTWHFSRRLALDHQSIDCLK